MWFKNIHLFRFLKPFTLSVDELDKQLQTVRFHPCGRLDMQTMGWISPLGRGEDVLTFTNNNCILFTARRQERILPASVVRETLAERIEEIEIRENRRVRGKEKKALQEEVLQDLIPRAFTRSSDINAYIDVTNGWLIVDTSSRKRAQEITSLLRKTLGSLPVVSPQLQQTPAVVLTEWLADQQYPADFALADACHLVDNGEEGATVSCKHQDLTAEEVHAHLDAGKLVSRLALEWNNRLSFVVDEEFVIKRLQMMGADDEDSDTVVDGNDAAQQLDADFALLNLELAALLQRLIEVFGGENEAVYQQMQV